MNKLGMCAVVLWTMGCGGAAEEQIAPTQAARELGIVAFDVSETDARLEIVGRGASGDVLASLELHVGTFTFENDDRGEVFGRQLTIEGFGRKAVHQSELTTDVSLPLGSRGRALQTFVLEPQVASRLAQWGIAFDPIAPASDAAEVPYFPPQCNASPAAWMAYDNSSPFTGGTTCTYATTTSCGAAECVQFTRGTGHKGQFVCCNATDIATERSCSTPGGTSACGTNGSNGCKVCWFEGFVNDNCSVWNSGGTSYLEYCAGNF